MKSFINTIILLSLLFTGCNSSYSPNEIIEPEMTEEDGLITHLEIAKELTIYETQEVTIYGRGFAEGDILLFENEQYEFEAKVSVSSKYQGKFIVPKEAKDGKYTLLLKRGTKIEELTQVTVIMIFNTSTIPDKKGATIKGVVYSDQKPLSGVRVSDGIVTTTTDENGFYWLNSEKRHSYVFVSLPSGYDAEAKGSKAFPNFWQATEKSSAEIEQHNFSLIKKNNDIHTLIVASDIHVSRGKLNNDIERFKSGFITDATNTLSQFAANPTYTFILGDMSHDLYWYSNSFDIFNYKELVRNFPSPMFHIMGNHDNDPYIANDFLAEHAYKKAFGPSYYSHNIGQVHYIMLDNNVYVNTGGTQGIVGDRSILQYIDPTQLQWLKEDLAAVTDKNTPIIVAMHCQAYDNNRDSNFKNYPAFDPTNKTEELISCFNGFTNVHILSGHVHHNANIVVSNNIMEHNIASVCETWWWGARLTETPVCKDGTPAGYAIYEINGKDIKWTYKGINKNTDYQFRTYDMNTVKPVFESADVYELLAKYSNRGNGKDYNTVANNSVMINIWNYDPQWKITVTEKETNKILTAKRTLLRDPLHTYCYEIPRWNNVDKTISNAFASMPSSHIFIVETDNATSTLEIEVVDRFGNVYKETMTRPKKFDKTIF